MPTVAKQLLGDVNLVAGDYQMVLPELTQQVRPNALQSKLYEEVFIKCDISEGAINIYLPAISTFYNVWNTKIFISCIGGIPAEGTTITVYPFQSETEVNTINGASSILFTLPFEANYLHIVDNNLWMCLNAPGVGPLVL